MKIPLVSGRQVQAALRRLGFVTVHMRGSHVKMKHPDGRTVIFPDHNPVDRDTLKGSLKDAGVAVADFLKHVR